MYLTHHVPHTLCTYLLGTSCVPARLLLSLDEVSCGGWGRGGPHVFADLVSVLSEGREVHRLALLVLHHVEVLETAQDELQEKLVGWTLTTDIQL